MSSHKPSYCRFCAERKTTNDIINLETELAIRNNIIEMLTIFNIDYVDFADRSLPETVCTSCYSNFNTVYEFFTKIKRSQEILSNLSSETFKTELTDESDHSYKDSNTSVKLEYSLENTENRSKIHQDSNSSQTKCSVKLEYSLENTENRSKIHQDSNSSQTKCSVKLEYSLENTENRPKIHQDSNNSETKLFNTKIDVDVSCNVNEKFSSTFNSSDDDDGAINTNNIDMSWCSYPWICKYCNMGLQNMNALRKHCIAKHSTCFGFRCVDCDADVDSFDVFIEHVRGHRECLNQFCPYCNIKFEDNQTVQHISDHLSRPNCITCGEIFQNEVTLRRHQKRNKKIKKLSRHRIATLKDVFSYGVGIYEVRDVTGSWKDYPWVCQFCNTKCLDQETLRCHTMEVHRKCFGMKCTDCVTNLDNFTEFIEHVRIHRPGLKYYCQYCDYRYDDPQQSGFHLIDHLETQMECDACGKIFADRSELQKHISSYNSPKPKRIPFKKREQPITIQDLTCDICQKVSKSLNNLRIHKQVHTKRHRDHTCDRCGKAFYTKGTLSTHKLIHENPDPQICKICKKSFLTLVRLKKHVKTHYGVKPFTCNECNRGFRLKEHLRNHMITHTDLMPYPCQYCDKVFKHKSVMKIHENQHTGARPYSCDECNMDFANWSNCNKHMKRKHGTTIAKNIMTPQGKLPINPKTGKPRKVKDLDTVKEWTEQIMVPSKRRKKSVNDVA